MNKKQIESMNREIANFWARGMFLLCAIQLDQNCVELTFMDNNKVKQSQIMDKTGKCRQFSGLYQ